MDENRFIPIGFTALRDPKTGKHLPAVQMYIEATEGNEKEVVSMEKDFGNLLAHRMKEYMDGCEAAGVAV